MQTMRDNGFLTTTTVISQAPEHLVVGPADLTSSENGDVFVDTRWSGISTGSERLLWSGRMSLSPFFGYPLVLGYESTSPAITTRSDPIRQSLSGQPHRLRTLTPRMAGGISLSKSRSESKEIRNLAAVALRWLCILRELYGVYFLLAGCFKFSIGLLGSDTLRVMFSERATELPAGSFAQEYLLRFAIPCYIPIAWTLVVGQIIVGLCFIRGRGRSWVIWLAMFMVSQIAMGGYFAPITLLFLFFPMLFLAFPKAFDGVINVKQSYNFVRAISISLRGLYGNHLPDMIGRP